MKNGHEFKNNENKRNDKRPKEYEVIENDDKKKLNKAIIQS